MMFWLSRHRRFRDQLSTYIDGALDPPAVRRLETHLEECARCRGELEQLRSTVAALQELPEAQVPRSFALSPERAAARRPAVPAAPLAFGARIAAAGVAVALAVVLVVDIGDLGGDDATPEAAPTGVVTERQADESEMDAAGAAAPAGQEPEAASGAAVPEPSGTPTAAEGTGEGTGEGAAEEDADAFSRDTDAGETPAAAPEEGKAPATSGEAEAAEDGGIDALTAVEIGLAAALGVLVVGSLILALGTKKR